MQWQEQFQASDGNTSEMESDQDLTDSDELIGVFGHSQKVHSVAAHAHLCSVPGDLPGSR